MQVSHIYKGFSIDKKDVTEDFPWNIYLVGKDESLTQVGFGKTLKECKENIDKNALPFLKRTPLQEHFDKYGSEYEWKSTLEEDLIEESISLSEDSLVDNKVYHPKDIVMVRDSRAGVHRILIVTKSEPDENGDIVYSGYILSSNTQKSNKYSRYSNNIYIKNYGTILAVGNKIDKEAIVKLDELHSFTKHDMSASGNYKGTVTDEFFNFILKCVSNMSNNISNKDEVWDK